ncbi:hypothetical protein [Tenacibaculum finnmarkense]|uniref:hypothetical protein n=1 Tax=Tenacibaculum finnmarkense TaxID=2781243 RepID=UPI001EFA4309|nr:hypothetical protein [Tenacibaculum finnmarkense]MCG8860076.1 hypothetical protein [Tenacibaculum finnmarkense]
MKAIEKAKIALRKHLLENKEQVRLELEKLRKISTGVDMPSYIDNLSNSFSIENISIEKEGKIDYSFEEIETYRILEEIESCYEWYPPDINIKNNNKKDSNILLESFFLIHLIYGRSTKSSIFI